MENRHSIASILQSCEEDGTAPPYVINQDTYKEARSPFFGDAIPVRTKPVEYKTNADEEIFVVSDLHIASGRNASGVYKGTENFFADDSFHRFLQYADDVVKKRDKKALLIINGDIFDFLRITEFPGKQKKVRLSKRIRRGLKFNRIKQANNPHRQSRDEQFEEWRNELLKIGIVKEVDVLKDISKKEKMFGLGTSDYKTIYKLMLVKKGHPEFFVALASWLAEGHKLIILKGNHDLELYWRNVRNYLRFVLAECIAEKSGNNNVEEILKNNILPNITFIDDSVEIDKDFYVEHGHRYDKFTMVLDSPALEDDKDQINIPFGSFFNRYLINRVELFYPFIDNVRPSGNLLPMLMKENFPLALKILFQHIPFTIRILFTRWRYTWFMVHKLFWFFLAISMPGIYIFLHRATLTDSISTIQMPSFITEQVDAIAMLFLSYALSRFVAWFQLEEPSSLDKFARQRFEGTEYRIMTMGHTHNPGDYLFEEGKRFYNTGTWIPVIETSTAEVREDKTFTFLHLERDEKGTLQPANNGILQRWNDDAGRAESQILVERK